MVCTKDNCSVCDAIENSVESDYKPFLSHFTVKVLIGACGFVLGLYIGLLVGIANMPVREVEDTRALVTLREGGCSMSWSDRKVLSGLAGAPVDKCGKVIVR